MNSSVRIGSRLIGPGHRPFVVAEMSGNHNGSLDRALAIVDAAADAGAHALKIQTYTAGHDDARRRATRGSGSPTGHEPVGRRDLYQLYERGAHARGNGTQPIFERARERGMTAVLQRRSTRPRSSLLETLDAPAATRSRRSRSPTCR